MHIIGLWISPDNEDVMEELNSGVPWRLAMWLRMSCSILVPPHRGSRPKTTAPLQALKLFIWLYKSLIPF